jgi:arsenate reductase
MIKVYVYSGCDTCRRALKWLRGRGIAFEELPIRQTPPSPAELRGMLTALDGNWRKLFNVAGADYRQLGLKDRLPAMDEAGRLALLAGNGNLVKRPFLLGPSVGLTGFDEAVWSRALAGADKA